MYPRRVTRTLFDGTAITTNTLPNRDYTHGRYHVDAVPGIRARIVMLPFLSVLAVERMAKLGVDTAEIRACMAAADEARMRLFDDDDREAGRRSRAARPLCTKSPGTKRKAHR